MLAVILKLENVLALIFLWEILETGSIIILDVIVFLFKFWEDDLPSTSRNKMLTTELKEFKHFTVEFKTEETE